MFRSQSERSLVASGGFFLFSLAGEYQPQVAMRLRIVRLQRDRPPNTVRGRLVVPGLIRHNSQKMPSTKMVWLPSQNLSVTLLRLLQASCLMALDRIGKHVRNVRHMIKRFVVYVLAMLQYFTVFITCQILATRMASLVQSPRLRALDREGRRFGNR